MVIRYFILLLFFYFLALSYLYPANKPTFKTSSALGFIENKGQIIDQNNKPNPSCLFLLNTPGFNVQLRKTGFSYDVYQVNGKQSAVKSNDPVSGSRKPAFSIHYHRIDLDLLYANPAPVIETSEPSEDYLNYYTTGTPVEGITHVQSYITVKYKNIYPGIDLQFMADNGRDFEYNFILEPGADISSIKLKISGQEKIRKMSDGIRFKTSIGAVDEMIPVCYYKVNGTRIPVKGRFKKIENDIYGFAVDGVVPMNAVLVIDPIPTRRWGTYYGACDLGYGGMCTTDYAGNVIIAGTTGDLTHIATAGAFQTILLGNMDAFLAKFSTTGQRMWGTYYGGSNSDAGNSCSTDKFGNIFLAGNTSSTDVIATPGAWQTILRGTTDSFVAKFTSAGMRMWGSIMGVMKYFPPVGIISFIVERIHWGMYIAPEPHLRLILLQLPEQFSQITAVAMEMDSWSSLMATVNVFGAPITAVAIWNKT